jgi:hypothetical protein
MRAYSLLLFSLLTLYSCRELVQDEFPDFTPVPTVNSVLVAGEPVIIQVSIAGKLDTNKIELVNDAVVLLFVDGQYMETLTNSDEGVYVSSIVAEPNIKYHCEVNIHGFPTVTCADSIPEAAVISNIIHINKAGKNEEGLTYPAIKFTFTNNPTVKQYYEVVIKLISHGSERLASLERITDPVLLSEGLPIALFNNSLISGSSYTMTINYTGGGYSSINGQAPQVDLYPLIIELRSVSSDYYKFVKQKFLYEQGRYPEFLAASITAFPLYSNVTGGYGIFSGYSAIQSDTIYP